MNNWRKINNYEKKSKLRIADSHKLDLYINYTTEQRSIIFSKIQLIKRVFHSYYFSFSKTTDLEQNYIYR